MKQSLNAFCVSASIYIFKLPSVMVKESTAHGQLNTCTSAESIHSISSMWLVVKVLLTQPMKGHVSIWLFLESRWTTCLLNFQMIRFQAQRGGINRVFFISGKSLGFSVFFSCILPDLETRILKAHHRPRVSWYNCFP